ncbi:DUF1320 family protein [Maribacter sp. ACAM166]|uniref:DUF1320 family protein n=1 Tax=Maribacter sp. ACAM166 TaxID=2508996 RepID=UPI0010FE9B4A|nr:DUF1320 family protein [Maribacter sp. ACAM166]TLP81367.1 DUF1320 domain-containing protein [Maribacter sp. ACAM166]
MAYRFLTDADFDAQIFSTLLKDESDAALKLSLEANEKKAIAIISSRLTGRYSLAAIFDADEDERNYLIIHYVVTITLYRTLKRNAARKMPSDFKEDFDMVMADLDKIMAGKLTPDGLPEITDGNGKVVEKPMHGNRRTTNFYI